MHPDDRQLLHRSFGRAKKKNAGGESMRANATSERRNSFIPSKWGNCSSGKAICPNERGQHALGILMSLNYGLLVSHRSAAASEEKKNNERRSAIHLFPPFLPSCDFHRPLSTSHTWQLPWLSFQHPRWAFGRLFLSFSPPLFLYEHTPLSFGL